MGRQEIECECNRRMMVEDGDAGTWVASAEMASRGLWQLLTVCSGAIDDAVDRWLPACTPEHPRYAAPLLRPGGGHAGSCASTGSDAGVRSAITSRMSQEEGDQLCRQG